MDSEKKRENPYCKVGDLQKEISETKKLSKDPNNEIMTLTVQCSAFFTLVCC